MVKRHARTKKIAPDQLPTTFGEQVTSDHLVSNRIDSQGHDGSKYAVVIYDIATRYRD